MSKKIFILFFTVILILAGIFCWNHDWIIEKDIIYLKNGIIIDADSTWTKRQLVYYQKNWNVSILAENDVEYIGKGDARQSKQGSYIAKSIIVKIQSKLNNIFKSDGIGIKTITDSLISGLITLIPWILFILIIAVLIKILRPLIKTKAKVSDKASDEETSEEPALTVSTRFKTKNLSDQDRIVLFFLDLYRIQIDAPDNAPVKFVPADSQPSGSGMIYELKVRLENEWRSRRMTIGAIGEESGSKSKCFYVIYDVHMVVKIPPTPLNNFQTYIENIRKERQIVDKLAPRECIIPKISVIMKIIHRFHDEAELTLNKREERYTRWLTNHAEKQSHLKIDNTLVYFMDLSKYFFLGHIIDNIHELKNRFTDEISKNHEIIWREQEFTGRYGQENEQLCRKLQNIYTEYEQAIKKLLAESDNPTEVHQYKIREWFLTRLSGEEITQQRATTDIHPFDRINKLSENILDRYSKVAEKYREIVKNQIAAKAFMRNKSQISSISSNLLELLTWLAKKSVAMRDLKPDNLLVAGEQSAYPQFLTSPDQFNIGLIDVETAVDIDTNNDHQISQPKLGGTPFYATPSQLFQNDLIIQLFSDLPRVLHLQDWYATIAMIYKVITGDILFEQTAKNLIAVKIKIQKTMAAKKPLPGIIANLNQSFWLNASLEFENKLEKNIIKLKTIVPIIPENVISMLHDEARKNMELIALAIKQLIENQTQFKDKEQLAQLKLASHQQIAKLKLKWENRNKNPESERTVNRNAVEMLHELSKLKLNEEKAVHIISLLRNPTQKISAFDLLTLMFGIVSNAMAVRV
ncbi:MAG: hypothetical protein JRI91_09560 [Deltaproteobacteria bacterium]|nr:hypothetical protein [Deltaproteobacteria bacterium]